MPQAEYEVVDGTIRIPTSLYLRLLMAQKELELLEEMGVDNWGGYDAVDWEDLEHYGMVMRGLYGQ